MLEEHVWTLILAIIGTLGTVAISVKSLFDLRATSVKAKADDHKTDVDEDRTLNARLSDLMERTSELENIRDTNSAEKEALKIEKIELLSQLRVAADESKKAREESEHLRVNLASMSLEIMASNESRKNLQQHVDTLSSKLDEALRVNGLLSISNEELSGKLDQALAANKELMQANKELMERLNSTN